MKSKNHSKAVLEGLKGDVARKNKINCHAELAVAQAKQQQPTWKIPNHYSGTPHYNLAGCRLQGRTAVWNDVFMDNNINNKSGRYRVKPGMRILLNVWVFPTHICHTLMENKL